MDNIAPVDGSAANPSASDTSCDISCDNPRPDLVPRSLRQFSLAELEAATNSFHRRNCIGEGQFGTVYWGMIPPGPNGLGAEPTEVAIKRMRKANKGDGDEPLREVVALGFLSHPHLVHLHGYCTEGDEALLVYDFMPGGSLDEALEDSAKEELFFSWSMRLKVAVQVAEVLAYMHGRNFIHGNLKAASVLLSPEYDTKLAGFGKVRVGPETEQLPMDLTRILGIWDVDLLIDVHAGHQGRKSDIYSFGVLLLELVTGRRMADKGDRLVTECRALFSDLTIKAADYTDPRLCDQYPERFARGLAIVAWHCVAEDKWRQPDIESILEKLKFLVEMCERDGADMAAEAAALEVGGLGLVNKGNAEANGGEERSSADVAPSA